MDCSRANPKYQQRRGIFVRGAVALGCIAALFTVTVPARAVEPTVPLSDLGRQAWVLENGLPQDTVQALVQTQDGFLWVGTEAGLARFDGGGFEVFDRTSTPSLPGGDVRSLLTAPDGALWIATGEGLARWKNGSITVFTTRNGLPSNDVRSLSLDAGGLVRASTVDGDAIVRGSRAVPTGPQLQQRDVWSSNANLTAQFPDGTAVRATATAVAWSEYGKKLRLSAGRDLPGSRIQALLGDREGTLWIGTNAGLVRWVHGKVEVFPVTDPLAAASILALLEDREGDIWVGTETDGLHILRDRRFLTYDAREGIASDATTTVVDGVSGTLWVGTMGAGLSEVPLYAGRPFAEKNLIRTYTVQDGLASNVILSLAAAPDGDLWVGTPDGLNRIRHGSIATFTSADGLPDDFIRSLLVDTDGSLWIGTRHGLAHWTNAAGANARMQIYTQASGLGNDLVGAMARDTRGNLWVATLFGLSRLRSGSVANFTTANGLSSDVVTSLLPRPDGTLLIGTEKHGLDVWNGQKFLAVTGSGLGNTTIHAILDDGRGHLWFATGDGIARCSYNESAPSYRSAGYSNWIQFGAADGLRSRQMATNSHPSAKQSRDGRLWFASPKGLVEVDPTHFHLNTLPPPVALERFAVDDVNQPLRSAGPALTVAAGHVHFEFDYAGLSFVAPQKVRYRYILEGFDHHWTDAGARRAAYYTNIPPGHYTFRVEAANNDGFWNTAGNSLTFELQRHFYQTAWFYALLLAAAAAAIVLFLRRRIRVAEGEFRAVLGERSRIAREIHDTLAQGYAGISVQLELLAELLRQKRLDDAAKQLDRTRDYVREGLADARQSIWALRTHESEQKSLPIRVRHLVERAGDAELETRFRISGAYRPVPAAAEQEILRVAQEAVHNVKKHARAKLLSVLLEYRTDSIMLEVRDNGRGVAEQNKGHDKAGSGHYGLTGMRERARAIGGVLEIESKPGAGTVVRLSAPAPVEVQQGAGGST